MDRSVIDRGRRNFLTGRRVSLREAVRPPWSSAATVASACKGCGACVTACPQRIAALDESGRPVLDFARGECTFCGACAQACPEPVFERAARAFAHVASIGPACFAGRGIVCQSCGDVCPESAIRFRPRLGGPALPELAADRCSGCGACIAACPAQAVAVSERVPEGAHG